MKIVEFFLLACFIFIANARPNSNQDDDYDSHISEPEPGVQNDDYEYGGDGDDDNEPEIPDPILVTTPRDFVVDQNDTVRLPCQLDNGERLVSMWKKNNEIIFQDTIRFGSFGDNFQIQNKTLIITNVTANETANYTCSIPLTESTNLNVTHRLFVRTPPKIESLTALHDVLQLDTGSMLVLTCKATGFPEPIIKWSRRGQLLGTKSETITIENISHHDAGDYQCLADNNIEPPAHKFIRISVVHKPIVKIEKLTVNSAHNLDTQLICNVHAVPEAVVNWKKDGVNIAPTGTKRLKHSNHTYILEIKQVQNDDFGIYTCSATNRVGRSDKNVTLTGLPSPPDFMGTHQNAIKNITVAWAVESNSPVIEHSLEYRRHGDAAWKSLSPEVINPDGIIYTVNYTLPRLGNGQYEARLRSRNSFGWSDYSRATKIKVGEHKHHEHHQNHHIPKQAIQTEERSSVVEQQEHTVELRVPDKEKVTEMISPPVVVEVPKELQKYTTEQTHPHTQQQAGIMKEGKENTASHLLPMLTLLVASVYSTMYSR